MSRHNVTVTKCRWGTRSTIAFLVALAALTSVGTLAYAQSSRSDIRDQIDHHSEKIQELEEKIEQYKSRLNTLSSQKQTLQSAIETLDVSRRKLGADISLTQERINAVQLEISQLTTSISDTEEQIERHRATIAQAIRTIDTIESQSLIEALLQEDSLAEFWNRIESLRRFNVQLKSAVDDVKALKTDLESNRSQARTKRGELVALREELAGQKSALDATRRQKARLLSQTKNQESSFQQLLAEKRRQKEQFQQELFQLESELSGDVDRSQVPSPGSGVLAWPVPDPSPESCWNGGASAENCITQYFGKTSSSGRLYTSGTHNGTDFRASPGTPVTAALSGTVIGTGNTDRYDGCYSYGKWVLIRHNNGLATMYAHLSNIAVSEGSPVATGERIGHSGNTGYSTGPHLHFTAYAAENVQVVRFGDYKKGLTNCPNAEIPVAPSDAYLDPMEYL